MPVVRMPKLGDDVEEAAVVRWLKSDGDMVARGEVIAEIETDKANVELEAEAEGLFRGLVEAGQPVPVGTAIATIGDADADATPFAGPEVRPETTAVGIEESLAPQAPSHASGDEGGWWSDAGRARSSPSARKLAGQYGLEIAAISGSGPAGRVVRADVVREAQSRSLEPVARVGETVAAEASVSRSSAASPGPEIVPVHANGTAVVSAQIDVTVDVRMDAAMRMVADSDRAVPLTITDLLLKAVSMAILEHPGMNASLIGGTSVQHDRVDLGLEIATDEGTLSAGIVDCGNLSLAELGARTRELTEQARQGRLEPARPPSTSIVVSNLGALRVDAVTVALGPARTTLVTAGMVAERPVVDGETIAVGRTMRLTCSADEHVVARALVAGFLSTLRDAIERPGSMVA